MPTVREIANLAGVSKSTVSLVLNNKPGVSEEKRQVILAAKRRLEQQAGQYPVLINEATMTPNHHPTPSDTLTILVLHPPVLNASYVFTEVLRGIQSAAITYNIQLHLVANDPHAPEQHVSRLFFADPALRPNGVLLFGAQQYEPVLEEVHRLGLPCVVLGRDADKYDVSGIGRDEYRYGYEATHHLISLGHQAIAFVGGQAGYDYVHNRVEGYKQALQDADLTVQTHRVHFGDGDTATTHALHTTPTPTAIIYVNDASAAAGLPIVQSAGLTIPDDLSVISFDDTEIARNHHPPLTSISYRRYEEGQWAVRMLVDQVRYPYLERLQVMFKADLIERDSCAAPTITQQPNPAKD